VLHGIAASTADANDLDDRPQRRIVDHIDFHDDSFKYMCPAAGS
jgi:hypothetical protein